jgi:tRNA G18 (ribose-2'-O)-methylase SpoU
MAKLKVTIPMAPGSESLNVAAAAAICLYEGARRR